MRGTSDDGAPERHVDGGGKEDRGDEEEEGLRDVGGFVELVFGGGDAGEVAADFHCGGGGGCVSSCTIHRRARLGGGDEQ